MEYGKEMILVTFIAGCCRLAEIRYAVRFWLHAGEPLD